MKQKTENNVDQIIETIVSLSIINEKINYHSKLEPFSVYAEKFKKNLRESLKKGMETLENGCEVLIEELRKKKFTDEEIAPYIINRDEIGKDIPGSKTASIKEKIFQNNFGFTDQMVHNIFEIIESLKHEKQYSKCINLLFFLLLINPFIPKIWLTLGDIWQEEHQQDAALYAYLVAINSAPFKLEPYRKAVIFCISTKNFDKALQILDYGLKHCEAHIPRNDEERQLPQKFKAIHTYVEQQKKSNS